MKIVKITSTYANDFSADMVCEHCGRTAHLTSGYHDAFYHERVIPAMRCKGCGKDRSGNTEHTDEQVTPNML